MVSEKKEEEYLHIITTLQHIANEYLFYILSKSSCVYALSESQVHIHRNNALFYVLLLLPPHTPFHSSIQSRRFQINIKVNLLVRLCSWYACECLNRTYPDKNVFIFSFNAWMMLLYARVPLFRCHFSCVYAFVIFFICLWLNCRYTISSIHIIAHMCIRYFFYRLCFLSILSFWLLLLAFHSIRFSVFLLLFFTQYSFSQFVSETEARH